jgi:hypothetical protein
MANLKISQLPTTTIIEGQEYYVIVQSGVTKKIEAVNINKLEKLLDVDLATLGEGDVLIYTGGTWVATGFTGTSGITYTGDADVTIGGITTGDTFTNTSMQDMWYTLLHPYQIPVVSLTSALPSTVEVGVVLNSLYNFAWTTTNDSNVSGTLSLTGSGGTLASGLATDGNTDVSIYFSNITETTETVTIAGTNTELDPFSDTVTTNWRYNRYYGISSSTTLNDGEVLVLTDEYSTTRLKTWTQDGNGEYLYYAYPSSWGDNIIPFKVNGLDNTDWVKTTRNVVITTGLSVEYIIYRSTYTTFGIGINLEKL